MPSSFCWKISHWFESHYDGWEELKQRKMLVFANSLVYDEVLCLLAVFLAKVVENLSIGHSEVFFYMHSSIYRQTNKKSPIQRVPGSD